VSVQTPAPKKAEPTLRDCDRVLSTCSTKLRAADGDPEQQALCRYEIDRWLDLRLALMRER
jgi:hypothetical protein